MRREFEGVLEKNGTIFILIFHRQGRQKVGRFENRDPGDGDNMRILSRGVVRGRELRWLAMVFLFLFVFVILFFFDLL